MRAAFEQLYAAPPDRPLPLRAPPARQRRSRHRPTRCSRTPGCASSRRARAGSRRARPSAPGCSRSRTTASSTCCAAAAAKSRSTRSSDDDGEPWQPDGARPGSTGRAPAGAAPQSDELAFWRRAGEKLLALPRAAAAAAAQRVPAPSRRRPRARRGRAGARGRLRDREDAPALRDEQAAHVHGRVPRAGAPRDDAMNDAERDAWLREALRHAPDSARVAAARRRARRSCAEGARRDARPRRPARARRRGARANPLTALWAWLARPPVAAGFASVMVATLVGVIWWDRPIDEAMPRRFEPPAATASAVDGRRGPTPRCEPRRPCESYRDATDLSRRRPPLDRAPPSAAGGSAQRPADATRATPVPESERREASSRRRLRAERRRRRRSRTGRRSGRPRRLRRFRAADAPSTRDCACAPARAGCSARRTAMRGETASIAPRRSRASRATAPARRAASRPRHGGAAARGPDGTRRSRARASDRERGGIGEQRRARPRTKTRGSAERLPPRRSPPTAARRRPSPRRRTAMAAATADRQRRAAGSARSARRASTA